MPPETSSQDTGSCVKCGSPSFAGHAPECPVNKQISSENEQENKSISQEQEKYASNEKEAQTKKEVLNIGGPNSLNSLDIEYKQIFSEKGEFISIKEIKGYIKLNTNEEFENYEKLKKLFDEMGLPYQVRNASDDSMEIIEIDKDVISNADVQENLRKIFIITKKNNNNRNYEYFTTPDVLR